MVIYILLFSVWGWGQRVDQHVLPQLHNTSSEEMKMSQENPLEMMKGKVEDVSKRTMDSRHYKNADGSYTALIGAGAMHYQKNGKWEEIDTKIKRNNSKGFPYANTSNLMESHFGATSHQGIVSKTKEGEIKEFLNAKMYWESDGKAINIQKSNNAAVRIEGEKAYYDNMYGNISAEYIVNIGQRKLNYIIPSKADLGHVPTNAEFLVFEEEIILPKSWSHRSTENGIVIQDSNGKEIYLYENPYSTDAENKLTRDKNTIFEISSTGNLLTIKTKVKTSWLLSNERKFPVMVDPTTTVTPNNADFWTGSAYSDGVKSSLGVIRFGRWSTGANVRGWAKFNISSMPNNIEVNNVNVNYYISGGSTGYSPASGHQLSFSQLLIDPVTASGLNIYNAIGKASYQPFQTNAINTIGYKNHTLTSASALTNDFNNQKPLGWFALGFMPNGNFSSGVYLEAIGHSGDKQRPYLIVDYSYRLTVSGAYIGASYPSGVNVPPVNGPITITPGERPNYVCVGWNGGSGNIPLTGTEAFFNISGGLTESSSINWIWVEKNVPNNVKFHNYGGAEQLTFNNSRLDTTTPKFSLSHQSEEANEYQIEINTNPTFASGTSWVQNFTGTYLINNETNFTFTNGFTPSNNTTYYVRARAKASVNNEWSDWTTETYSFTYQTPKTNPDWFQTTQAQFQSDTLSGVNADANDDVVIQSAGGNVINNGSFETNLNGWTKSSNFGTAYVSSRDNEWSTDGNYSLLMYNNAPGTYGYTTDDYISMYQVVDLTNISNLLMDANYESSSQSVELRIYIADISDLTGANGTLVHTWRPPTGNNQTSIDIDLSSYDFIGDKVIKLVYYVYSGGFTTNFRYLNIDNVRTIKLPKGTITSTPIHLASVQGATAYKGLTWNQTLGGGNLTLKIQGSTDGITFSDLSGYTAITETGDGEKTFDLSGITSPAPHIRLVGTLDGAGVKMHDWAVQFQKEEPCDKMWTGANSTDWHTAENWLPIGVPTNTHCVNIPNVANKPEISTATIALAKSLELQESAHLKVLSGANLNIVDEVLNHGDETNFVIENEGSLIQENSNSNTGEITYKRTTSPAWAKDFIYLGTPVQDAKFSQISNETGKNFSTFYSWITSPGTNLAGKWSAAIGSNSTANLTPALGYIARIPNNWTDAAVYQMAFKGIPNNGEITIPFKTGTRPDDTSTTDVDEGYQDKWVLLSNPYPSAIDALAMLNLPSNKDLLIDASNPTPHYNSDGALYFWNHKEGTGAVKNPFYNNGVEYSSDSNNHYIVKTFTGTIPATSTDMNGNPEGSWNGKIPSAQAFFIRGKENADGEFTFNNEMRVSGDNGGYYKNANPIDRFWLDFTKTDDNKSAQALIGYLEGATNGLDFMYDGLSMGNDLDIYSLVESKNLSIQGRASEFNSDDVVKIGYDAPETGLYRIGLFRTEGLFAPHGFQHIYLKDKDNGIVQDLISAPYEFTTESGRYDNRFEIIYKNTVLNTENANKPEFKLLYDGKEKRWLIISPNEIISKVEIYDLSGKLIWVNDRINTKELGIPYHQINQKVALVKVYVNHTPLTSRKIINPQ